MWKASLFRRTQLAASFSITSPMIYHGRSEHRESAAHCLSNRSRSGQPRRSQQIKERSNEHPPPQRGSLKRLSLNCRGGCFPHLARLVRTRATCAALRTQHRESTPSFPRVKFHSSGSGGKSPTSSRNRPENHRSEAISPRFYQTKTDQNGYRYFFTSSVSFTGATGFASVAGFEASCSAARLKYFSTFR